MIARQDNVQTTGHDPVASPGSLRTFHIFFIVATSVVAVALGIWAFSAGHPLWAMFAILVGVALLSYEHWFEKKAKDTEDGPPVR